MPFLGFGWVFDRLYSTLLGVYYRTVLWMEVLLCCMVLQYCTVFSAVVVCPSSDSHVANCLDCVGNHVCTFTVSSHTLFSRVLACRCWIDTMCGLATTAVRRGRVATWTTRPRTYGAGISRGDFRWAFDRSAIPKCVLRKPARDTELHWSLGWRDPGVRRGLDQPGPRAQGHVLWRTAPVA